MNKHSRLSSNSPEWARLEYLIQLSLGSTTVSLKNVWSITNPHTIFNFEKRSKTSNVLESWFETSRLDNLNKLEKVCVKGFDFPEDGLLFPTGHISLMEGH